MAEAENKIVLSFGSGRGNTMDVFLAEDDRWWEIDIDYRDQIKTRRQRGDFRCSYACKLSVDNYIGGGSNQEEDNLDWYNATATAGLNLGVVYANYRNAGYSVEIYRGNLINSEAIPWMIQRMESGNGIRECYSNSISFN